jgi:hypothetical protein
MKKFAVPILSLMILLTIACGIGPPSEGIDYVQQMTDRANEELEENLTSGNTPEPIEKPAATSEPDDQPGPSSPAETYGVTGDFVEYSVSGLDNGCVCSVGGNMMISLEVQDDKLFFNLPDGTSTEFAKVGANTYKRDFMGYYIDVNPETGEETRVDEERHEVIILTDNGFIREYYHGSESDPCCYHFYTSVDQAP